MQPVSVTVMVIGGGGGKGGAVSSPYPAATERP